MTNRREAISTLALSVAGWRSQSRLAAQPATATGPFKLPPLGYAFDALEPYIDAQTMEIHHDRHHAGYVANLNKAVSSAGQLGTKTVEELLSNLAAVPEAIRTAVRNNGGGHANHTLFWQCLSKSGSRTPVGELAKAIDAKFGSFNSFKDQLTQAATTVFGSGWAWLTVDKARQLAIVQSPNQDSPISMGQTPLLGIDVWEHAYYLKYQNRRADYIAAFHNVINWDWISQRYRKVSS